LKDAVGERLLRQAVETIDDDDAFTRSFAVRGAEAGAAMVAHVVPIRRSARDIFMHCVGVLVLTPVTLPQAPPVELVQSLFDLTPAEARVARGLTTGATVEEIASTAGVYDALRRHDRRGLSAKDRLRTVTARRRQSHFETS
jgi:hypothetical protein